MLLIEQNKKELLLLCKKHNIDKLYLFGSATNNTFNEKSDIDLVEEQTLKNSINKNKELIYG